MTGYGLSSEEREAVTTFQGKAGTMRLIYSFLDLRNDTGRVEQSLLVDRHAEFEGMEFERERTIVKFLVIDDHRLSHWVSLLLDGLALDDPGLLATLARLGDAGVVVEEPQPPKDILSLTKEFIHDHSQQ